MDQLAVELYDTAGLHTARPTVPKLVRRLTGSPIVTCALTIPARYQVILGRPQVVVSSTLTPAEQTEAAARMLCRWVIWAGMVVVKLDDVDQWCATLGDTLCLPVAAVNRYTRRGFGVAQIANACTVTPELVQRRITALAKAQGKRGPWRQT